MSRGSVVALLLFVVLACGGTPAPEPAPGECCTVDDVIRLTSDGMSDELIIATLRTTGVDLALTADDITHMQTSGVSEQVIDVANGGPCVCEEIPEPPPVATASTPRPPGPAPEPAAAGLKLAVKYGGGKSFELVNLSTRNYTNVTVLVNDEYQYRLKKLKANAGDFMRLHSFISRKTGAEASKKLRMKKIHVKCDQGTYSRTF